MTVRPGERGAALVVTLVFVTAMAAAAVAFLAGRRTDALNLRGQLQAVESQAMLDAALKQTVALLVNRQPRQTVPPLLTWQFGDVAVRVRFEREAGKIDLNAAPNTLLRALPLVLGLDESQAAAFADVVQDWRDDNQLRLDAGAEDRDYRGIGGAASGAADRPFANPAELRYLPVVDPVVWSAVEPYVTVYSGAAEPSTRYAPIQVREAVKIARTLQVDDSKAAADAKAQQDTADGGLGGDGDQPRSRTTRDQGGLSRGDTDRTRPIGSDRTSVGSDGDRGEALGGDGQSETATDDEAGARSVLLDVRFPNGYEAAAKAVIALAETGARGPPYVVLDWTPILRTRGDAS